MYTKPLTSLLIAEKMHWRLRQSSLNLPRIFTQPKTAFLPNRHRMLLCSLRKILKWMNRWSNKCCSTDRLSKCSKIIAKPWQNTLLTESCWVLLQFSSAISSKKNRSFLIARISFFSTMTRSWAAGSISISHPPLLRLRIDLIATISSSSMKLSSQRSNSSRMTTEP